MPGLNPVPREKDDAVTVERVSEGERFRLTAPAEDEEFLLADVGGSPALYYMAVPQFPVPLRQTRSCSQSTVFFIFLSSYSPPPGVSGTNRITVNRDV